MKKLLISLGSIAVFFCISHAYTPTSNDTAAINTLKTQLDTITSGNMQGKAKLYIQLKNLQEQFSGYEKLNHYLHDMDTHLMAQINTEKTKAKVASQGDKETFVHAHSGEISVEITTADTCTGRYNTMDSLSFAYDLPTALTLAVRYRESNCGYYLPSNTNGPFQIISKNYGT